MAWKHLKAATESDLYDGQGSYKNIMYRICSLARKDGQQHAGWCTASENYLAETTGFSLRQVQRAVAQFKRDGVFAVRTYRQGGKEFNHYRPNDALFNSRKRSPAETMLVRFGTRSDIIQSTPGTRAFFNSTRHSLKGVSCSPCRAGLAYPSAGLSSGSPSSCW